MLGDFPQNAWHIRGFPRKDVFVAAEEVDERAFLFRGKRGTNVHHFAFGAPRIYEDFSRALYRLERSSRLLSIGCLFGDFLLKGGEFLGGDDCGGVAATFDFALISALEGGADGDDPVRALHL